MFWSCFNIMSLCPIPAKVSLTLPNTVWSYLHLSSVFRVNFNGSGIKEVAQLMIYLSPRLKFNLKIQISI